MVDILQKNVIIILWAWHRAPAKDSKGEKQMLKKMKNNKKGFTLVELIVVLVILAILAALLIPALTGYIDKAKRKSIVAETRQVVMAAQTLVDEAYGSVEAGKAISVGSGNDDAVKLDDVKKLAEVKGTVVSVTMNATEIDDSHPAGTVVAQVVYKSADGKTQCTYYETVPKDTKTTDGNYDVTKVTN